MTGWPAGDRGINVVPLVNSVNSLLTAAKNFCYDKINAMAHQHGGVHVYATFLTLGAYCEL
jgi:hypothetical protein